MGRDIKELSRKKLWILDMDGTVYLGDRLFDETLPFLERIKANGARYLFFTNNASRAKSTYVDRLNNMGIPATADDILTSAETTLQFLHTHRKGKKVYLIGTPDLEKRFAQDGIELSEEADIVVVSFDTTLVYEKLSIGCRLIRNGAEFLSTHPDFNCPVEGGFIPDSGAICALVTASTGKTPRYFGKPYPEVLQAVEEHTGISREDMVVVGDRLYTDIALGADNGVDSVLVLTGETSPEDEKAATTHPAFIADSIGSLLR